MGFSPPERSANKKQKTECAKIPRVFCRATSETCRVWASTLWLLSKSHWTSAAARWVTERKPETVLRRNGQHENLNTALKAIGVFYPWFSWLAWNTLRVHKLRCILIINGDRKIPNPRRVVACFQTVACAGTKPTIIWHVPAAGDEKGWLPPPTFIFERRESEKTRRRRWQIFFFQRKLVK